MHAHLASLNRLQNTRGLPSAASHRSRERQQDRGHPADVGEAAQPSSLPPYLSDLAGLGDFLFGPDKFSAQRAFETLPALCAQSLHASAYSRLRSLRREFIQHVVSLKRYELDACLALCRGIEITDPSSFLPEKHWCCIETNQHTMLHRVVLVMMFREDCAWSDCARLLRTTESIIQLILQESLWLL